MLSQELQKIDELENEIQYMQNLNSQRFMKVDDVIKYKKLKAYNKQVFDLEREIIIEKNKHKDLLKRKQ